MKRMIMLFALLLLSASVVTAQDDRLQVVASHSILEDVVRQVAGDAADVTVTMPLGADPHAFEPVPSDITALANADVVFVNGALFEESLMDAIENAALDMNLVTASACVEIRQFGEDVHDEHDADEHGDDHEDDHEADEHGDEHSDDVSNDMATLCNNHHAELDSLHGDEAHEDEHEEHADDHDTHDESHGLLYASECDGHHEESHEDGDDAEGDSHDEHEHGACDPHVWMHPHNVVLWTMMIRDTLVELDPAHADTYTNNAAAYITQLDAFLHDVMIPAVESVPQTNRVLVTNHDSLGYFADTFDFEIVSTVIEGGSSVAEPSPADLVRVIDTIREANVSVIFSETTVSDDIARTIAAETGAELLVLYSGSLGDADSPASTYLDYMRYNVRTIVTALGGSMP